MSVSLAIDNGEILFRPNGKLTGTANGSSITKCARWRSG